MSTEDKSETPRQQVADLLWTIPFEDTGGTLTLRDAEFGARVLEDAGLLADDRGPFEVQWGVGTENEAGELIVMATPSEGEARKIASHDERIVVSRLVSAWKHS